MLLSDTVSDFES